jgi:hypothetical protein
MTVRIARPDLDHGGARAKPIQERAKAVVGAAVVGNLQDLDRR